jgi:uncharacterized membrane protein
MTARKTPPALGAFLAKRGLWILFVEVTLISTATSFSPLGLAGLGGRTMVVLQTLFAIGASMIVLSGAQFLGRRACLAIGAIIVLGHNSLDAFWPAGSMLDTHTPLWVALHAKMSFIVGPFQVFCAYPLLPWVGVMLLGFGSSSIFERPPEERNRLLFRIGLALISAFVVLRGLDVYGDPLHWRKHSPGFSPVMSFLNTTKYPPSLLYLLMTLGPAAVVCSLADRFHGWLKDALVMFGRVPFAFYVAHHYLAHGLAVLLGMYEGYSLHEMLTFFGFNPKGFGVPLVGVYVMWILVIALLYPFCRWVAGVKARRKDWWLSYL